MATGRTEARRGGSWRGAGRPCRVRCRPAGATGLPTAPGTVVGREAVAVEGTTVPDSEGIGPNCCGPQCFVLCCNQFTRSILNLLPYALRHVADTVHRTYLGQANGRKTNHEFKSVHFGQLFGLLVNTRFMYWQRCVGGILYSIRFRFVFHTST